IPATRKSRNDPPWNRESAGAGPGGAGRVGGAQGWWGWSGNPSGCSGMCVKAERAVRFDPYGALPEPQLRPLGLSLATFNPSFYHIATCPALGGDGGGATEKP